MSLVPPGAEQRVNSKGIVHEVHPGLWRLMGKSNVGKEYKLTWVVREGLSDEWYWDEEGLRRKQSCKDLGKGPSKWKEQAAQRHGGWEEPDDWRCRETDLYRVLNIRQSLCYFKMIQVCIILNHFQCEICSDYHMIAMAYERDSRKNVENLWVVFLSDVYCYCHHV